MGFFRTFDDWCSYQRYYPARFNQVAFDPHGGSSLVPFEYFGGPTGTRLDHCCVEAGSLTLLLETIASTALARSVGQSLTAFTAVSIAALADLPCFGKAVRLVMTVRRFFCAGAECPRRIFCEHCRDLLDHTAVRPIDSVKLMKLSAPPWAVSPALV